MWSEVEKLLANPIFAKDLLEQAKKSHEMNDTAREKERLRSKISGIAPQVQSLMERLGQLPKDVSAEPIFKQMHRLETTKKELEASLSELKKHGTLGDLPVDLKTYENFLEGLKTWKTTPPDPVTKQLVIERLIDRIEVLPDALKISFAIGQNKIERELLWPTPF